jgi:GPI mannosyltransferase 3
VENGPFFLKIFFLKTNAIISLGLLAHLLAAVFSVGHHHCDEYFQIIEFASYKLGITPASELPWEFAGQMRSSLQPVLFLYLHQCLNWFSVTNHFTIVLTFRLLHSLIAFTATLWFTKLMLPQIKYPAHKTFLLFLSLLLWSIPYFHARHSSENLSTSLFLFGLCTYLYFKKNPRFSHFLLSGLFFGLAFVIRFQAGFLIAGFGLWLIFIQKEKLKQLLLMGIALLAAIALGILIDKWFYGNWTFTAYNYFNLNIVQDKVSGFGREPFYFFITETLLKALPPFSIFILISFGTFWILNRRHYLSWISLIYIAIHFMVPHKELRFLFPMLAFIPFVFCHFADMVKDEARPFHRRFLFIFHPAFTKSFLAINTVVLLIFIFKPADDHYKALKFYYNTYSNSKSTIYYAEADPYSNAAALNYFRSPQICSLKMESAQGDACFTDAADSKTLYYIEAFVENDVLEIKGKRFKKVYCTWPKWIRHFNFNNWLERSFTATLFEMESS